MKNTSDGLCVCVCVWRRFVSALPPYLGVLCLNLCRRPRSWRSSWRRTCSRWRWTAPTCWSTSTEWAGWRKWPWCEWPETSSCTVQARAWSESQSYPTTCCLGALGQTLPLYLTSSQVPWWSFWGTESSKVQSLPTWNFIYDRTDGRLTQVCPQ